MPNSANQQRQLAALQSKQQKTQADLSQIAALERKLANKLTFNPQQPLPQRARPQQRRKVNRLVTPPTPKRDGTENMMTPLSYQRELLSNKSRIGSTAEGRAWYHQAVHPPSAPDAAFAGLPDFSTQPRATPQFVTTFDVGWDDTLFATAPTSPVDFSIWMAIPDIPEIASMYFLRDLKNGTDSMLRFIRTSTMTGNNSSTAVFNTFNGLADLGYSMARMTSSSITGIYAGTTLNDAGMVYCASISPQLSRQSFPAIQQFVPGGTNNTSTPPTFTGTPNILGAENGWDVSLYTVPLTSKGLVQADPAHYRGRAREGIFAVQKFDKSLLGYDYTECGSGDAHTISAQTGGTVSILSVENTLAMIIADTFGQDDIKTNLFGPVEPVSQVKLPSASFNTNLPNTNTVAYMTSGVTPHSGMSWTVIRIEGLSIANAERFSFERRITLDAQVPYNSNLQPYIRLVPPWDEMAVKAVMMFQREMPSGMPANCNGFMDWVRGIFSFLNKNSKPITDVVKMLPIPGAAIAADIAQNILPTVDGLLSGSSV
jgi:hypothetical protein